MWILICLGFIVVILEIELKIDVWILFVVFEILILCFNV